MQPDYEAIKKDAEAAKKAVGIIIHLLEKMNEAMEEGFSKVNDRLANIEGKNGMIGVNKQLGDIKEELQKIQKVYPYNDMFNNMKDIAGEA